MPSERVRIAREGYEAWNRGDFDGMVENIAPDAEWCTSGVFPDFDPVYRGHDGIRRFWDSMHDAWDVIEILPKRFVEHGDKVLAEMHFQGRGRENRVEVELEWVQVFTYRENVVIRVAGFRSVEDARESEWIPDD